MIAKVAGRRGDYIEEGLRTQFEKRVAASRSRIKRLRGISRPQYRRRVDEMRVFHDVVADTVEVLAVVEKAEASSWLAKLGSPN
jgi:hypothetical protein